MMRSTGRRPRHGRPSLEELEPRLQLSTFVSVGSRVYPFDFVGPIPTGAVRGDFLHSNAPVPALSQPPPPPPQPPTPPTFWVSSPYLGTIGASVILGVDAGSLDLVSVKYAVSSALEDQPWAWNNASFARTSGATHTLPAPASEDSWDFTWDENPGQKTMVITATDTKGNVWVSNFQPVTVTAPTAEDFQITAGEGQIGTITDPAGSSFGFYVANNGLPGVSYSATITSKSPGLGFFVQLANDDVVANGVTPTGTYTSTTTTNGTYALDSIPPAVNFGTGDGGYRVSLPGGGATTQVGNAPTGTPGLTRPFDAPGQYLPYRA